MEILAVPLILILLAVPVGVVMGMIAFGRTGHLARQIERLRQDVRDLERLLQERPRPPAPPPTEPEAPSAKPPSLAETLAEARAPEPVRVAEAPVAQPAPARPVESDPIPAPALDAPVEPSVHPGPVLVHAASPRPSMADAARPAVGGAAISGDARSFESEIGKRWLTWAGVGIVFLAAVFFLKYAYDQGWLGRLLVPPVRVALIAAAGAGAVAIGLAQIRRGFTALGQGLAGGGIALAYLAVYGAFAPGIGIVPEPLVQPLTALVLMAVVSAAGMACAVRGDALAMAVVATLGGLLTPVLVSTGSNDRDLLAGYLLVLDLAVLAAAAWKSWRGLDLLAFVGTAILLLLSTHQGSFPEPDLPLLAWLLVFHLVFLGAAFALHWRTRTAIPSERYALALANLAFGLGWTAIQLNERQPFVLAAICFVLAAGYLAMGMVTRRRIAGDARVFDGFAVLSATLVLLGLFYLMPVDGVAWAWAVEAAALAWLGHRFAMSALRWSALVVLGLALMRCVVIHLFDAPSADLILANRWFFTMLATPAGCAGLAWVHWRWRARDDEWRLARVLAGGAALLLLALISLDLMRHADGHPATWAGLPRAGMVALVWAAGAAGLLAWGRWRGAGTGTVAGTIAAAVAACACLGPFFMGRYVGELPFLDLRFLAGAAAIAVLAWAGATVAVCGWAAFILTVLLLSLEPSQWCHQRIADTRFAGVAAHLSVTVAWIACAAALLTAGFMARRRPWRFAALALFGLTAGKLLLVDMADARQLTRIIAFLVVGLVLIASSWAYHRYERRG